MAATWSQTKVDSVTVVTKDDITGVVLTNGTILFTIDGEWKKFTIGGLITHLRGNGFVIEEELTDSLNATVDFDGDRQILRVPQVGDNLGTSNLLDWHEWWYFAAPTMSISQFPTSAVYEVGDSVMITFGGTVSNPGNATLSNGAFIRSGPTVDTLVSFGSGYTYIDTVYYVPTQDSTSLYKGLTYSFRATQNWAFGSESGTANSSIKTIQAVYPILYGVSATDLSVGGDAYTTLTKLVETEGNKTVSLTGSGFIYYAVPKTWSDFNLSEIIDHNNFNVTPSFTAYDISVTSSGMTNNWTTDYKLYKLNTTTIASGYAYQFKR